MILFVFVLLEICFSIERPLIGLITQPSEDLKLGHSSIPASYVKWIESAGGKVVPFFYDLNETDVKYLLTKVNGFVFPGGGVDLSFTSQYMITQKTVYDYALEANKNGDYFPIHATCLGFESLLILTSENDRVLEGVFDSYNLSLPLNFEVTPTSTRMFSSFPQNVIDTYEKESITLNNHHSGLSPKTFASNKFLSEFYTLISTNKDRNGKEFISTIEGKEYPIYGTQWHPEKVIFEDRPICLDHTFESVLSNQYISYFLVNEARKSDHSCSLTEQEKYLIYNYNPVYTFPSGNEFEQMYYFPKA